MSLSRRTAIAAGLAVLAHPALADDARDAAPTAADATAWGGYEQRLRDRLKDAGGGRFDDPAARAVLDLTNKARAAAGAGALAWHGELAEAARAHAADLAQRAYVEHLSPEGFDPSHRLWLVGRTTIGSPSENIAYHRGAGAPATAASLMDLWRGHPDHWRNVLRPSHTHAAFALVRRGDRSYLVGLYARPLATLPEPLPFRALGPDIGRALRSLGSELRPRLGVPQGSKLGQVEGAPPVMQLTAIRRTETGQYDVIGGPIFLATDRA